MTTLVTIVEVVEPDGLYSDSREPLPARIEIDPQHGMIRAEPSDTDSVSAEVWSGFTQSRSIPRLTAEAANRWMATIAPIAQRIAGDWDTRGDAVTFGDTALHALDELDALIGELIETHDSADLIDVVDEEVLSGENLEAAYEIDEDTSDQRLEEIHADVFDNLAENSASGVVVTPQLWDHLVQLRDG